MPVINFRCKKCNQVFDCDVGKINFAYRPGERPQFERDIQCKRCGVLTMDEVELTEWGQTQLSELHFKDMGKKSQINSF